MTGATGANITKIAGDQAADASKRGPTIVDTESWPGAHHRRTPMGAAFACNRSPGYVQVSSGKNG